jgi:hypothetical protein
MQELIGFNKAKLIKKINLDTIILIFSSSVHTLISAHELTIPKTNGEPFLSLTYILSLLLIAVIFFYWSYSSYKLFLKYNNNNANQNTFRKTALGGTLSRFVPIMGVYYGYLITQEIATNKSGTTNKRIAWLFAIQCLAILMSLFYTQGTISIGLLFVDFICGTWAVMICSQTQLRVVEKI